MNGVVIWLVILSSLVGITLIVLITAIALYLRQLVGAVHEMTATLTEVRQNIIPLSADVKRLVSNSDGLVLKTREQVDRIGRLLEGLERLIEGITIVEATSKVFSSSKTTVISVLEGLRHGLRVLRTVKSRQKEESSDE